MSLQMKLDLDETSLKLFSNAMDKMAWTCVIKGLKAMGKPIADRMKQIVPDSTKPRPGSPNGTRAKWGPKYRNQKNWQGSSKNSIGVQIVRTNTGGILKAGPTYPKGNKLNFNANVRGKGRKEVFWKKAQSTIYMPETNWRQEAYYLTKAEQNAAFQAEITKAMKEAGLG